MNKNTSIVSQHPIVRGLKEECKYPSNPKKKTNNKTHTRKLNLFLKHDILFIHISLSFYILYGSFLHKRSRSR